MGRQNALYTLLSFFSIGVLLSAANGQLQRWSGLDTASGLVILALVAGLFALQHAFSSIVASMARQGIRAIVYLTRQSHTKMRALLHSGALAVFTLGVAIGIALGSNVVLGLAAALALTVGLATEMTFMAQLGPLADFLRHRGSQRDG